MGFGRATRPCAPRRLTRKTGRCATPSHLTQLCVSIHSLYICLPARLMINKETCEKSQFWGEIREPIKKGKSKTESIRLILCWWSPWLLFVGLRSPPTCQFIYWQNENFPHRKKKDWEWGMGGSYSVCASPGGVVVEWKTAKCLLRFSSFASKMLLGIDSKNMYDEHWAI